MLPQGDLRVDLSHLSKMRPSRPLGSKNVTQCQFLARSAQNLSPDAMVSYVPRVLILSAATFSDGRFDVDSSQRRQRSVWNCERLEACLSASFVVRRMIDCGRGSACRRLVFGPGFTIRERLAVNF